MNTEKSRKIYLYLAAIFIAALVVCNLIANKFISIDLGFKTFVISAGVLPYPITFLITDLLSEIYGKKKTARIVWAGFAASIFVLGTLLLAQQFTAIKGSPVDDESFNLVFGNSWRVIFASMGAYLCAQLVDVRIYHFWKQKTHGKYLWLRNNFSTILSQGVDTSLVVMVLFAGLRSNAEILQLIIDGWIFKMLCAFIDTPLLYASTAIIRRKLGLKFAEEVSA
ncbi:MAG: queuosine precursor transporter [Flavobacteriales bacterium]|nr:queuosine precursor transporter [Flavobacteriales bacterium]